MNDHKNMNNTYPAIIEQTPSGYFSVFFPDVPGCVAAGKTVKEASSNAEEALSSHLEIARKYGETVNSPSSPDNIKIDPEVKEVTRIMVTV